MFAPWARLTGECRWVAALAAMTLLATIAAFIAGAMVGVPTGEVYEGYLLGLWALTPSIVVLGLLVYIIACAARRVDRPLLAMRPFLADRFGTFDRAAGTLGPIALMPLLMGAFGTLKQMLPLVNPFGWDNLFGEIGPMLFDGVRPWQVTHYVFGSPIATVVLDRVYTGWIVILFLAIIGFALFAEPRLRARFFLAFGAGWILLGLVTAYFFSSAGPCFAADVGSKDAGDFAQLMVHLRAIDASGYHLYAIHWQDTLWKAESSHHYGFALGISAMPSMHSAISFLYVLAAAGSRRLVRIIAWLFAVTILIASVHLGWHYLIDGLIGWAGMTLIWWGAGAFLRRLDYHPESELQPVAEPASFGDVARPLRLVA